MGHCASGQKLASSGEGEGDLAATQSSDATFEDVGVQTLPCTITFPEEEEAARKAAEEAERAAAQKAEAEEAAGKVAAAASAKLAEEAKRVEELEAANKAAKAKEVAEAKAAEKAAASKRSLAKKVAGQMRALKVSNVKKARTNFKGEIDVQKNVWQSMALFKGKEYTERMDAHSVKLNDYIQSDSNAPATDTSSLELVSKYCQENKDDVGELMIKQAQMTIDAIHSQSLNDLAKQLDLIAAGKKPAEDLDELISACKLSPISDKQMLTDVRILLGKADVKEDTSGKENMKDDKPRKMSTDSTSGQAKVKDETPRRMSKDSTTSKEKVKDDKTRSKSKDDVLPHASGDSEEARSLY